MLGRGRICTVSDYFGIIQPADDCADHANDRIVFRESALPIAAADLHDVFKFNQEVNFLAVKDTDQGRLSNYKAVSVCYSNNLANDRGRVTKLSGSHGLVKCNSKRWGGVEILFSLEATKCRSNVAEEFEIGSLVEFTVQPHKTSIQGGKWRASEVSLVNKGESKKQSTSGNSSESSRLNGNGVIQKMCKNFGFISKEKTGECIFFHMSSTKYKTEGDLHTNFKQGMRVKFKATSCVKYQKQDKEIRWNATNVSVVEEKNSAKGKKQQQTPAKNRDSKKINSDLPRTNKDGDEHDFHGSCSSLYYGSHSSLSSYDNMHEGIQSSGSGGPFRPIQYFPQSGNHRDPLVNYLHNILIGSKQTHIDEVIGRIAMDGLVHIGPVRLLLTKESILAFLASYSQFFKVSDGVVSWDERAVIPMAMARTASFRNLSGLRFLGFILQYHHSLPLEEILKHVSDDERRVCPASLAHNQRENVLEILSTNPSTFIMLPDGSWSLVLFRHIDEVLETAMQKYVNCVPIEEMHGYISHFNDSARQYFSTNGGVQRAIIYYLSRHGHFIFWNGYIYNTQELCRKLNLTLPQLQAVSFIGASFAKKQSVHIQEIKSKWATSSNVVKKEIASAALIDQFLQMNSFFFSVQNMYVTVKAPDPKFLPNCIRLLMIGVGSITAASNTTSSVKKTNRKKAKTPNNMTPTKGSGKAETAADGQKPERRQSGDVVAGSLESAADANDLINKMKTLKTEPFPQHQSKLNPLLNFMGDKVMDIAGAHKRNQESKSHSVSTDEPGLHKPAHQSKAYQISPDSDTVADGSGERNSLEQSVFGKTLVNDIQKTLSRRSCSIDHNLMLVRLEIGKSPSIRFVTYEGYPAKHETVPLEKQPSVSKSQLSKICGHPSVVAAKENVYAITGSLHYMRAVTGHSDDISSLTWFYYRHLDTALFGAPTCLERENFTAVISDAKATPISIAHSFIRNQCRQLRGKDVVIVDCNGQLTGFNAVPHETVQDCYRICAEKFSSHAAALDEAIAQYPDCVVTNNVCSQQVLDRIRDICQSGVRVIAEVPITFYDAVEVTFQSLLL